MAVPGWAVANLGIQVGSSLLGSRSKKKAARAQQAQAYRLARLEQEDLLIQSGEVRKQTAQARFGVTRDAAKARGAVANSAANAGVSGIGVTLLDREVGFEAGLASSVLDANERSAQAQIRRQYDTAVERALAGVTASRPNPLATGLQILGSFADFLKYR